MLQLVSLINIDVDDQDSNSKLEHSEIDKKTSKLQEVQASLLKEFFKIRKICFIAVKFRIYIPFLYWCFCAFRVELYHWITNYVSEVLFFTCHVVSWEAECTTQCYSILTGSRGSGLFLITVSIILYCVTNMANWLLAFFSNIIMGCQAAEISSHCYMYTYIIVYLKKMIR